LPKGFSELGSRIRYEFLNLKTAAIALKQVNKGKGFWQE